MSVVGDYLTIARMPVAITTSISFVVGGLSAPHPTLRGVALLGLAGVLLQTFACHINDTADIEGDRRNPARQGSPLVQGRVTVPRVAYWAIVEAVLLSCAAMALTRSWPVRAGFAFLVVLTAWVNTFQKTSRLSPVIIDYIFGIAMAAPIPLGALALGGRLGAATLLLTVSWITQMVIMNCTVGNLKDLELDRAFGSRTTALALGVREQDGQFAYTRRYVVFVLITQSISVITLAAACVIAARWATTGAALALAGILIAAGSTAALARLLRDSASQPRGPAPRSRLSGLPRDWLRNAGFILGNMAGFLLGAAACTSAAGVGWFALAMAAWFAIAFAVRASSATLVPRRAAPS